MKYIKPPPPVLVTTLDGTPANDEHGQHVHMDLSGFILGRLTDRSFATDMTSVLSAVSIKAAVTDGVIALETADWERLKRAVEKPEGGYNPLYAHNLVEFMRAIVSASDTPPEPDTKR